MMISNSQGDLAAYKAKVFNLNMLPKRTPQRFDVHLLPCEVRWARLLDAFMAHPMCHQLLISRTQRLSSSPRWVKFMEAHGLTVKSGILSIMLSKNELQKSPVAQTRDLVGDEIPTDLCQLIQKDGFELSPALKVTLPPCDWSVLGFLYLIAGKMVATQGVLSLHYAHHHESFLDHIEALRFLGLDISLRMTKRDLFGLWSSLDIEQKELKQPRWTTLPVWLKRLIEKQQSALFFAVLTRLPGVHRLPGVSPSVFSSPTWSQFLKVTAIPDGSQVQTIQSASMDDLLSLLGHHSGAPVREEVQILESLQQAPRLRRDSKSLLISIDGPAGAGKSTVSKLLARRLNYQLIDTGAMFRSVAYCATEEKVAWDDVCGLERIADGLSFRFVIESGENLVWVKRGNGEWEDWSQRIRTSALGAEASRMSVHGSVRSILLGKQRLMGKMGGVVMEGRDVGSVVFPDAELKFFLTASVRARAQRRWRELIHRGETVSLDHVEDEIRVRDEQDSQREVAPLVIPDGAEVVDASDLSLLETVDLLERRVASYLE